MGAIELQALPRDRLGDMPSLLTASKEGLDVRLVEPVHVLSLRYLPGGAQAVAAAVSSIGIATLPGPGRFSGDDPLLVWRNPGEWMFIGTRGDAADALRQALPARPGANAFAYAIDQSAGSIAFELQGRRFDEVLHRLLDATAAVTQPGHGTRVRLADIAVTVLRLAPQRGWLIADRAHDHYLANWIGYALEGVGERG